MSRVPLALSVLLAGSAAAHGWVLLHVPPTHAVLPIFVPVSLEHEARMRGALGQPAGRGGEEAVELARALEGVEVPASAGPALERLKAARLRLLALRDRRHQLNVALMNVGVELGQVLTADQWTVVISHRDTIRAADDGAAFDRVLAGLK